MTTLNDFSKTDSVDDVLATYYNMLLGSIFRKDFANAQTMAGTVTLTDGDTALQRMNCNGANRIVKVPTGANGNHPFFIINSTSTGAYTLSVQSYDGTITHAVLYPGEFCFMLPDGNGLYRAPGNNGEPWISAQETWTYASASTFTVSGDRTARYKKGALLRWTQTTVKYGVVISSSYSAPNTTVTIFANTDYTIANAAISVNYYSYEATPPGFPASFNWTPSWGNLSVGNATVTAKAAISGTVCKFSITLKWAASPTTSISGTVTIAPPITTVDYGQTYLPIGSVGLIDWGVSLYMGALLWNSTTSLEVRAINAASTYAIWSAISSTVPFTWGANDLLTLDGQFIF